jgi:hypothetical protein
MSESKLITFFKEASSYTSFERIKQIYEFTNDLDLDLLFDFKREYTRFGLALKTKVQIQIEQNLININFNDFKYNKKNKIYQYIVTHLQEEETRPIDIVIEEIIAFIEVIDDLIKRKLSDLPKNSRHKNNLNYQAFVEQEPDELDFYVHIGGEDEGKSNWDELIDLSDTSLIEKVIYLEKLGIIEFLRGQRPFSTSANSVANVFSAITGAKPTSLQPIINPLINKDYYNKNYPLNSKKTVISVENKLMSLGYEIKKRSKE